MLWFHNKWSQFCKDGRWWGCNIGNLEPYVLLKSTTSTSNHVTLLNAMKLLPHIPQLCILFKQELVIWIHALVNPLTKRIYLYCIILLLIWTLCTFLVFMLIIFYCKAEYCWLGLASLHMELKGWIYTNLSSFVVPLNKWNIAPNITCKDATLQYHL